MWVEPQSPVDIHAIGLIVKHHHLGAQLGKEGLGCDAGRAVGAVTGDFHAVQGEVDRVFSHGRYSPARHFLRG